MLHIIPSIYGIEEGWKLPGTRVLMKTGKKLRQVKARAQQEISQGKQLQVSMVENCGMEGERIYQDAKELPEEAGYYTLLVIKEET